MPDFDDEDTYDPWHEDAEEDLDYDDEPDELDFDDYDDGFDEFADDNSPGEEEK